MSIALITPNNRTVNNIAVKIIQPSKIKSWLKIEYRFLNHACLLFCFKSNIFLYYLLISPNLIILHIFYLSIELSTRLAHLVLTAFLALSDLCSFVKDLADFFPKSDIYFFISLLIILIIIPSSFIKYILNSVGKIVRVTDSFSVIFSINLIERLVAS